MVRLSLQLCAVYGKEGVRGEDVKANAFAIEIYNRFLRMYGFDTHILVPRYDLKNQLNARLVFVEGDTEKGVIDVTEAFDLIQFLRLSCIHWIVSPVVCGKSSCLY